jgi:pyrroline-5-carboxylate reductase
VATNSLVIIGGGNMGASFARGALSSGCYTHQNIVIIDHRNERLEHLRSALQVCVSLHIDAIESLSQENRCIIVAVKPQDFASVALSLGKILGPNDIVLSCMAGVTLSSLQGALKCKRVARCMPNLPIEVQQGVIGICYGDELENEIREQLSDLLSSVGSVVPCDDEKMIDAITALTGSGPGYLCFLIEQLIDVAQKCGFDSVTAQTLIVQMMHGTMALLTRSGLSPSFLRAQVTSPRGTTEAAVSVLEQSAIGEILEQAIYAALTRAKELAG